MARKIADQLDKKKIVILDWFSTVKLKLKKMNILIRVTLIRRILFLGFFEENDFKVSKKENNLFVTGRIVF